MTSLVAEMERVVQAQVLAGALGRPVAWLTDDEKAQIFGQADATIYGAKPGGTATRPLRLADAGR
jgi:hypothetical protein